MLFDPYMRFHIFILGNRVTAYWEIAAHSAFDMFSKCWYLIGNLVFPTSVFGVGISFWLRLFLIIALLYLFNIKPFINSANTDDAATSQTVIKVYLRSLHLQLEPGDHLTI